MEVRIGMDIDTKCMKLTYSEDILKSCPNLQRLSIAQVKVKSFINVKTQSDNTRQLDQA
jgi:hypothetical protein